MTMNDKRAYRLGLFIPYLSEGGAGRAVSRISELLADEYEIYLVLFDSDRIDYVYKGTVVNMKMGSKPGSILQKIVLAFKRVRTIKKIKRQYSLDAMISFLDIANICNILSWTKSCKAIASVRGSIFSHKQDGIADSIKKKILSILYNKADMIVAVSQVIRRDLIQHYHLSPEKVVTIYNPYNIDNIRKQAQGSMDVGIADFLDGKIVVFAAGQFVYVKGFWHLIKAFSLVKKSIPNVVLLLCGEGILQDKLEKLISDLHLENDIKLPGFLTNPFPYMKRAQAFVLTSLSEGFPNALVEAMICGTPVVSADCASGPREILTSCPSLEYAATEVERVEYGILVPRMEPEMNWNARSISNSEILLSKALEMLLTEESLQRQYIEMAARRAMDFNIETCKENYIRIIEQCMKR